MNRAIVIGILISVCTASSAFAQQASSVTRTATPVLSPPLRTMPTTVDVNEAKRVVKNFALPRRTRQAGEPAPADPVVQPAPGPSSAGPTGVNFEGVPVSNSAPPDTNGDVGKNHYVQWVNTRLAVWDKAGNLLYGPVPGNTLFESLGGVCASHNNGDPIAQYDPLSDRWVLSQFVVGATDGFFSHECVAVSQTGDPLGAYYLYDFPTGVTTFVDYPHWGMWTDGWYMATHQFEPSGDSFSYAGQGLYVFEREAMLMGQPARMQFHFFGSSVAGALPSDLDSLSPPPPGAPNYVVSFGSPIPVLGDGTTFALHIWKVKATWGATPSLSVSAAADVPVAPFNNQFCTANLAFGILLGARPCVPEPAPAAPVLDYLDEIADRLMYRLAYRHFPNGTPNDPTPREVLVLNHTVSSPAQQAAVRWYEIRNPGGTPQLVQQSTYAGPIPDDKSRWMGSIAMDNGGNILLGYSKSGLTVLPEIDVAGRRATDPPNVLGAEVLMKAGQGVQFETGNRWGDYSSMSVDAFDGCSFWYTNQYLPNEGSFNWRTRIGAFRFPAGACAPEPQGRVEGIVTDCATGAPLSRVLVQVSNGFSGATDANGRYSIVVPPGKYSVVASSADRLCGAAAPQSVTVDNGAVVPANFCVSGAPRLDLVSTSFSDAGGNGNGTINQNECVQVSVGIANNGCGASNAASGLLSTVTPGVTVDQPKASYPDLAIGGSGTSLTPYSITTAPDFVCGTPIEFELTLRDASGVTRTHRFSTPTCQGPSVTFNDSLTAADARQTSRMGRDSSASECAAGKACPGAFATATGQHLYDKYAFTNSSSSTACVTVNLTADASCAGSNQIQSVAYLGAFDPGNLCTNYLADSGSSPDLGFNKYSFRVPAGQQFNVVVNAVQDVGVCSAYTLTVSGLVDSGSAGTGPCATTGAPPVATDDQATTFEGTPVSISVLSNDSDGGSPPLEILSVRQPRHGTATKNADGTITYAPASGFNSFFDGPDSFQYTVANNLGFTDVGDVSVNVAPLCTYTVAGDASFDFDAAAPGWTVDTAASAGVINWSMVADPTAASTANRSFFTDDPPTGSKDDRLVSPAFNLSTTSRLEFSHRFNTEDTFDGGVLEVSRDGGATWQEVTAAGAAFLQGGYNSNATGFAKAWSGLSAGYPGNTRVVVDVSALAGLNRRFRFRMVADSNTGTEGWHVDDVKVTNLLTATNCQPPPPIVTCFQDDASQIAYSTGWHTVIDPNASAGHFRLHNGKDQTHFARMSFGVPAGKVGAVIYHYATSTKGGSAEAAIDGITVGSVNYKGASGSQKAPAFGSSARFGNLAPGSHAFELRAMQDAVYVDSICVEAATVTTAPAAGPGATTTSDGTINPGAELARALNLDGAAVAVSVLVETGGALPIQLVVVDPKGQVLGTASSVGGVASLTVPVSGPGLYLMKVVNTALEPVHVWTAVTPQLKK